MFRRNKNTEITDYGNNKKNYPEGFFHCLVGLMFDSLRTQIVLGNSSAKIKLK